MATFTGTNSADAINAGTGIAGTGSLGTFTGGTLGELEDGTGDSFTALAGADSIIAGSGNDTIQGGAGNDTLAGGLGDDTFVYGYGSEFSSESVDGGGGMDTLLFNGSNAFQMLVDVGLTSIERMSFAEAGAAGAHVQFGSTKVGVANPLNVVDVRSKSAPTFADLDGARIDALSFV